MNVCMDGWVFVARDEMVGATTVEGAHEGRGPGRGGRARNT